MKKLVKLILALSLGLVSISYAGDFEGGLPANIESYPYRIMDNGTYISYNASIETAKGNRFLYPLRFIMENADYQVEWLGGKIRISKDKFESQINLSQTQYMYKNRDGSILIEGDYFKEFKDISLSMDRPNKTLIMSSPIKYGDIISYNLGSRSFKGFNGETIDYELIGSLTSNIRKKKPLVIILHGSHSIVDNEKDRYDLGFAYLMNYLSKDYLTLSLNVNPNYSFIGSEPYMDERLSHIFDETLKALDKANQGDFAFGVDLKNRIDFENVFLIGHSRSGMGIFKLADQHKDSQLVNIKGLMAYAPAEVFQEDYPIIDLPTSIILPELDGDVSSQDGQGIFDQIMEDPKRKSLAQLVYLYGGNHNSINEALLVEDEGLHWFQGEKYKITSLDEQDFIKRYSLEFLNNIVDNKMTFESIEGYDGDLLGYKALVSNYQPGTRYFSADQIDDIRDLQAKSSTSSQVVQSFIPATNTAGIFNHPGNHEAYWLLKIDWREPGASLVFNKSFSSKASNFLSLYLAQDSTSSLNNKQNQCFTILLSDKYNRQAKIRLDGNTPALWYSPGQPIFEDTAYSNNTPLSILNIDLTKLENFDKDNIRKIEFLFDQNKSGSLILKYIDFN